MVWLVVAALFAAAWVWAFYREDRLEREPVWMVGLAFGRKEFDAIREEIRDLKQEIRETQRMTEELGELPPGLGRMPPELVRLLGRYARR